MAMDHRNPTQFKRSESSPAANEKPSVLAIRSRFESTESVAKAGPVFGLDFSTKLRSPSSTTASTPSVTPTSITAKSFEILNGDAKKTLRTSIGDKMNNNGNTNNANIVPLHKTDFLNNGYKGLIKPVVGLAIKPADKSKQSVNLARPVGLHPLAKALAEKSDSQSKSSTNGIFKPSINANSGANYQKMELENKSNTSKQSRNFSTSDLHNDDSHKVLLRPVNKAEDTKSGFPLSKSSSRSSQTSLTGSHDSSEHDYLNENYQCRGLQRRNTKPPQSIVARRTMLFEKSIDEIQADPEEAEAYSKMRELGTAFKPKYPSPSGSGKPSRSSSISSDSPKPILKTDTTTSKFNGTSKHQGLETGALRPTHVSKPQITSHLAPPDNGVTKLLEQTSSKLTTTIQPAALSLARKGPQSVDKSCAPTPPPQSAKPSRVETEVLPAHLLLSVTKNDVRKHPVSAHNLDILDKLKETKFLEASPPSTMVKPSQSKSGMPVGRTQPIVFAPPKPPRTFEHKPGDDLLPDGFDPISVVRQAGDGEERSVDGTARTYTLTVSSEIRPYASLTLGGSSGGEESIYSESSIYDTLGRASIASSCEHYDTISQSEFDSDVSRPPTLPRRPSNLRHRPLTTAFSHLDLSQSAKLRSAQRDSMPDMTIGNSSTTNTSTVSVSQTIKEASPTTPSPTKMRVPFKLKYLLPKTRRKNDDLRKASSMADLVDEKIPDDEFNSMSNLSTEFNSSSQAVHLDENLYAQPEIQKKQEKNQSDPKLADKNRQEKIRLKLNQAFAPLRRAPGAPSSQASDGEEEERPPGPEVLDERLRHCSSVREHATYASVEQIRGFMNKRYTQLYDYAVIVSLRKNPDTNIYEPYCKFKFPPQVDVEQTTVPQFCFPDGHIWHKTTDYKSEAFSFVLTDVTGARQYGYCRRMLPPDLNNLPRMAEVMCIVSPLNATRLYSQVLDEVEKRRRENSDRAEEFLQAVYGKPLPPPGQSVTICAMSANEEKESFVFTRSPDAQREGIEYEALLNHLSVSQVVKIFACILLERKIIFVADRLSTLSSCIHAFVSLIYPFSWQHTFIPLLPPPLIDVVCAPTPYIVGVLSANLNLLNSLDDEMDEVLIVDLDNNKFMQRFGDEKTILPKKLHRSLVTALDMAKSEGALIRNQMVSEAFLRFFLETVGCFNDYLVRSTSTTKQFMKEEFVSNSSNAPSIMVFLQWFVETQMFSVYATERENETSVTNGTFDERVVEFKYENHDDYFNDHKKFKKLGKLFGKKGKK